MELELMHREIDNRLTKLNISEIWEGFRLYAFALYNDDYVVMKKNDTIIRFPRTDEFMANTAILYEGKHIAIWKVTDCINFDILASKLLHEMFHAYQQQMGDCRFADESGAVTGYRYSSLYFSVKRRENKLLLQLSRNADCKHGCEAFGKGYAQLCGYRRWRKQCFPYEYDYDAKVETIEGAARYVELAALKVLAPAYYDSEIKRMTAMLEDAGNLFPTRPPLYETGALLLTVLKKNGGFDTRLNEKHSFSDMLLDNAPNANEDIDVSEDEEVKLALNEYNAGLEARVSRAILKEPIVRAADGKKITLAAFNSYAPETLAKQEQIWLYSSFFVMYHIEGEQSDVTLMGDFLICLDESGGVSSIYRLS